MDNDLLDRRDRTFELLIAQGRRYTDVVDIITDEFDITKSGVKADISRLNEWLPKLVEERDHGQRDGKIRLRELKKNRERLQRLAADADDAKDELAFRRQIEKSIQTELKLRQSIGLADREETTGEKALEQLATGAMRVEFEEDRADQEGDDPLDDG